MSTFNIRPNRALALEVFDLVERYKGERVYVRGEWTQEDTEDEGFLAMVGPAPAHPVPGDTWTYVSADSWLLEFHDYQRTCDRCAR